MKPDLANLLSEKHPLVLDGALATELERRGEDLNDPLWSARVLLEAPEKIQAVHLDYFRSGADFATTASYQATVQGFASRGLTIEEALDLIKLSVNLAKSARKDFLAEIPAGTEKTSAFIAGSIGPYGAFLADGSEYSGDYGLSEAALVDFHRPRMSALVEAGADILACETIPCLIEAKALVRLLEEFPGAGAWISFSAKDGGHTNNGEPISACAEYLNRFSQVVAIGVNCTAPRYIPDLIRAIRSASEKPVIVYPNSGEVYDVTTRTWQGETSCDAYGAQARTWLEAGADIIGGCCRTTPAHIAEVKKNFRQVHSG